MAKIVGNDVNMMPGFMVIGISCFGMPYGAASAGWVEVPKEQDSWTEIIPVAVSTKYIGDKNAT